jgi:hypothetical protein
MTDEVRQIVISQAARIGGVLPDSDTASPTLVVQPILTRRVTQILSHLSPGHLGDTPDNGALGRIRGLHTART